MEEISQKKEITVAGTHRGNTGIENLMSNPETSGIRTIAVFTMENPDSHPVPENGRRTNHPLPDELKSGNYVVIPSTGTSGNNANSLAVLNVSLEAAMHICRRHRLTSFLFSVNDNGNLAGGRWEVQNTEMPYGRGTNPYIRKDTENSVIGTDDAHGCCAEIGKVKFTIPFSVLQGIGENIGRLIREGHRISSRQGILEHSMKSGLSPYLWRGAIYRGIL